jgi:hypothetical protein
MMLIPTFWPVAPVRAWAAITPLTVRFKNAYGRAGQSGGTT